MKNPTIKKINYTERYFWTGSEVFLNMEKKRTAIVVPILRELLYSGPEFGEEQPRLLAQQILTAGEEALAFLFLEIARRVRSSAPSPSTPSRMIPLHLKDSAQTGK